MTATSLFICCFCRKDLLRCLLIELSWLPDSIQTGLPPASGVFLHVTHPNSTTCVRISPTPVYEDSSRFPTVGVLLLKQIISLTCLFVVMFLVVFRWRALESRQKPSPKGWERFKRRTLLKLL